MTRHSTSSRGSCNDSPVLKVEGLRTEFVTRGGPVHAVRDVSLSVAPGRILALVGESGSGKSALSLSLMRLLDLAGRVTDGHVWLEGREMSALSEQQMRTIRGRRMAMVFQNPMTALNPTLQVGTQMVAALRAHVHCTRTEAWQRGSAMLSAVGIPSPDERMMAYAHQLSGGMLQRISIAIALLHQPALVIADEATTALDVTIQSQILALVRDLSRSHGTGWLWITHDLSIAAELANDLAVMYAGRIVESGPAREVLLEPAHPYTRGLLDSLPRHGRRTKFLPAISGVMPDPRSSPRGCSFAPRCPSVRFRCLIELPDMHMTPRGTQVRCHFPLEATSLGRSS
jgi:peptide/nickel transport system ATP-binding protein